MFLMNEVPLYTLCLKRRPPHSREGGSARALPTETEVESGTSQCKSGTSVDLSDSGNPIPFLAGKKGGVLELHSAEEFYKVGFYPPLLLLL